MNTTNADEATVLINCCGIGLITMIAALKLSDVVS